MGFFFNFIKIFCKYVTGKNNASYKRCIFTNSFKKEINVGLAYISQIGFLTQNIKVIENKIYMLFSAN